MIKWKVNSVFFVWNFFNELYEKAMYAKISNEYFNNYVMIDFEKLS